jgi:UDP:flavonoid glycosyltransferase YjiC (YdhE family)
VRVLVTTFPGQGHFHPVAPVALALQTAGHEVRVATERSFAPWVEECGLRVVSGGRPEAEVVAAATAPGTVDRAIRQFTTVWVPPFVREVLGALDDWHPDVVLSEEGEHGGPLVGAVLEVPVVTHSWPAPARPPATRAALAEALDDVWQGFGCPQGARVWGDIYLDCCPPPLQTPDVESIAGVVGVRPVVFDGPPVDPPAWLERLDKPAVLVTLGTVSLFIR